MTVVRGIANVMRYARERRRKRRKQRRKRGPPTMSNIAGLSHPWECEPEHGGWLTGVEVGGGWRREKESRERVQRREELRSISVPPPSPFRHSHFSLRSALHHSASHPPSFVPLFSLLPLPLKRSYFTLLVPWDSRSAGRCFPTLKTSPSGFATDCSFQIHYWGPCQRFARV